MCAFVSVCVPRSVSDVLICSCVFFRTCMCVGVGMCTGICLVLDIDILLGIGVDICSSKGVGGGYGMNCVFRSRRVPSRLLE